MDKILYLECESGISGDMSVAALLDLGADGDALFRALDSLNIEGLRVSVSRVSKSGLDCADFNVLTGADSDGHDHDMEYLYGHTHGASDGRHAEEGAHSHADGHTHTHGEHGHSHSHTHGHSHRSFKDIKAIIDGADLTAGARELSLRIFDILAGAEAKAHGVGKDEVHFHEVGAADSIADIVGFAVCYDNLGIKRTVITDIAEGGGTVRCRHGILPVPVPAVANIAAEHGLRLKKTGISGELVTPTGAAIAAAVRTDGSLPESYIIKKTGLGAGKRSYELSGFVRAMLIEDASDTARDAVYRLESDIDDCGGEALGFAQELLYGAGAKEVHFTPIYMKKNRPAYELVVICGEERVRAMEEIIFGNTTTIGIRKVKMERAVLERELISVKTSLGEAQVKVCGFGGRKLFYPEYESAAAICRERGLSYWEAYEIIQREAAVEYNSREGQ
ncbi:MAG: nickel pincer cofactor biosynthesis protein LarC [Butyrivibrio sp.]|nr:nickel pincer cofactor biosynthesis protein LarC [Butyrivibrio sp.]